jgi:hypothetical protein
VFIHEIAYRLTIVQDRVEHWGYSLDEAVAKIEDPETREAVRDRLAASAKLMPNGSPAGIARVAYLQAKGEGRYS